ncbi:flagellar export chaperone FlgN [Pseudokineococcus basanitobsidens]|uniref:Flagellar export chaperone FlgN n=1 Tax=Pseudokineococcus basanitobsidens TaxID=1926649 RepID=A0ABU8RG68_9ACTN
MGLAELSNVLWREREVLELLLFKLEEEQLVLSSGRTRWLAHATREVEVVLDQVRGAELERAVHVDAVATEVGAPAGAGLRQLAEAAPAPWDEVLGAHRDAFLVLTSEISATAQANRDVLSSGRRALDDALASLGEVRPGEPVVPVQTYGPRGGTRSGAADPVARAARLVDESL